MARILIVEDEVVLSRGIQYRLQNLGYDVAGAAYTGEEAISQTEETRPDLVLMDIHLRGGIDGIEAAAVIQTQYDIPIIYVTAYDDEETIQRAKMTQPFGFLLKPFDEADLRTAIEMALYKHQMEQELKQARDELQKLNASKNTFVSILAHDLRGPLSSLRDSNQILLDNFKSYNSGKLQEVLQLQQKSFTHLCTLLDNLLTWARIQQEMIEVTLQPLDLHTIAAWNLQLLQPKAEQKGVILENLVQEQTRVLADLDMLHTVMRNLLSNAVKFTKSGDRVTISAHEHQGMMEIAVADTGIGMSAEDMEKLFRIDVKFKRPGTEHESGTGLGLILCKEFVEKLGGKIRVESQIGQGTAFTLTLPIPA